MDAPTNFTDDEKRFVLSEIIRTSQVDVELLARFVANHDIQPEWPQWTMMQIPHSRNLRQCMDVATQLTSQASQLKRKRPNELMLEGNPKRPAFAPGFASGAGPSHHAPAAVMAPAPVHIAPRPSNGHRSSPHPSPPPPAQPTKKRGRPSRADKAKRDLRPLLPQHLAPRPSEHTPGTYEPRPILPAPAAATDRFSKSPISDPRTPLAPTNPTKRSIPPVDISRPRVLSDGAVDRLKKTTRAYLGSDLPPIEPELRAGISRQTPSSNSPTTLAPLLSRNSPANTSDSPSQAARSTPVTNSA